MNSFLKETEIMALKDGSIHVPTRCKNWRLNQIGQGYHLSVDQPTKQSPDSAIQLNAEKIITFTLEWCGLEKFYM